MGNSQFCCLSIFTLQILLPPKGAATVDTAGRLRCFDLYDDLEGEERGREQLALAASAASKDASKDPSKDPKDPKRGPCKRVQEIVTASGVTCLHDPETKVQSYSPKQGRMEIRFPVSLLKFQQISNQMKCQSLPCRMVNQD